MLLEKDPRNVERRGPQHLNCLPWYQFVFFVSFLYILYASAKRWNTFSSNLFFSSSVFGGSVLVKLVMKRPEHALRQVVEEVFFSTHLRLAEEHRGS